MCSRSRRRMSRVTNLRVSTASELRSTAASSVSRPDHFGIGEPAGSVDEANGGGRRRFWSGEERDGLSERSGVVDDERENFVAGG
jgi:hypothetical protein